MGGHIYMYIHTGWGGQSWTNTFFFLLYRPLYLTEAYVWPEKYWLVWAGPLANHPFNFNFIFLSDGLTAAAERAACFADLQYTAASQRYSAAMDGRRVAKLAWGVAWPFFRPTLPVEKSSKYKFSEYRGQSARNRNSATAAN